MADYPKELRMELNRVFARSRITLDGKILPVKRIELNQDFDGTNVVLILTAEALEVFGISGEWAPTDDLQVSMVIEPME
jgi:hypothetical protein